MRGYSGTARRPARSAFMRRLLFLTSVAFLASCGENGNVNPPTEPAAPIETAEAGGAPSPAAPGAPGAAGEAAPVASAISIGSAGWVGGLTPAFSPHEARKATLVRKINLRMCVKRAGRRRVPKYPRFHCG